MFPDMPSRKTNNPENRARKARLAFRVDKQTKALVERAATLERRNVTDFCLTAMTDAARQTIANHETLVLSVRDQQAFFDALVHPPKAHARLKRAFKKDRTLLAS